MSNILVNAPKTAKRGAVIEIKALILHPMETGFRPGTMVAVCGYCKALAARRDDVEDTRRQTGALGERDPAAKVARVALLDAAGISGIGGRCGRREGCQAGSRVGVGSPLAAFAAAVTVTTADVRGASAVAATARAPSARPHRCGRSRSARRG